MINYSFEDNIFNVKFIGTIEFDDIMQYLDEFSKIDTLPKDLLLLYEARNVNFKFEPEKVEIISIKAEDSTQNYKTVRTAFLVDEPMIAVYSTLFSKIPVQKKTQRNIFSTKQAAIRWLLPNKI